jgi:hypothetical protein
MLNLQGRRPKIKQSLFFGLILEPITTSFNGQWLICMVIVTASTQPQLKLRVTK